MKVKYVKITTGCNHNSLFNHWLCFIRLYGHRMHLYVHTYSYTWLTWQDVAMQLNNTKINIHNLCMHVHMTVNTWAEIFKNSNSIYLVTTWHSNLRAFSAIHCLVWLPSCTDTFSIYSHLRQTSTGNQMNSLLVFNNISYNIFHKLQTYMSQLQTYIQVLHYNDVCI